MSIEKRYLCAKEVAKLMGVSVRTAQRLMASGDLKSFSVGKSLRTDMEHVLEFVAKQFELQGSRLVTAE